MHGAIPGHGARHGGGDIPVVRPAELVVGLVDLQVQQGGCVRGAEIGGIEPLPWPMA